LLGNLIARLRIVDVFAISGRSTVVAGLIEQGAVGVSAP
jgi:translation elongation factor EF-Tu-like GTPase